MVEDFIKEFTLLLVDKPELVKIENNEIDDSYSEITIYAHKSDTGKLIGKEGKMINSLKTVISGCKAKDNRSYKIMVKAIEE